MKIAIISDTHLGYKWEDQRSEDSFIQAEEAFNNALDCDLILLGGDIFNERTPKPEVWSKALGIFSKALTSKKSNLKLTDTNIKRELPSLIFSGIPLVAIHGTHERRSKSFINPIQLLEKAGYLIHLNGEYVVFEKNSDGEKERVAIFGMSGVPERFAPEIMSRLNFKGIKGAYNILLLHQSIGEYVYSDEEESILKISDLPDHFDLIIDGHIHWYGITNQKNLVFPGSTVITQMRKIESKIPKGFLKINTKTKKIDFIELKKARKFFYKEIEISDLSSQELNEKITAELNNILENNFDRKPLVKFVLKGNKDLNVDLNHLNSIYRDKVILNIKKHLKLAQKNYRFLEEFKKRRKSIDDLGKELLDQNLDKNFKEKLKFDFHDFFELLAENKTDEAYKILMKNVKQN